jgi:hypothetical protein
MQLTTVPITNLRPHPKNPRLHNEANLKAICDSLQKHGQVDPLVVGRDGRTLLGGHGRMEAMQRLGWKTCQVVRVGHLDDKGELALCVALNKTGDLSHFDPEMLASIFRDLGESPAQVEELGVGFTRGEVYTLLTPDSATAGKGSLQARFGAPPFSVLDGRAGYWLERKVEWHARGLREAAGRENLGSTMVATDWMKRGSWHGGSAFDPVLAEVMLQWFCPEGGSVLDPFAGEATKGFVAGCLGRVYLGVELRAEQVAANRKQWAALAPKPAGAKCPQWLQGDAAALGSLPQVRGKRFDMVFTSPPYWSLEEYKGGAKDGSAKSYPDFVLWLREVLRLCAAALKPGRFAVVKVGETRNADGTFVGLVPDTVKAAEFVGLAFYNELILLDPLGSLPVRVGRAFRTSRKVGKCHQNILVFCKGTPAADMGDVKNGVADISGQDASG